MLYLDHDGEDEWLAKVSLRMIPSEHMRLERVPALCHDTSPFPVAPAEFQVVRALVA